MNSAVAENERLISHLASGCGALVATRARSPTTPGT